MLMSWAVTANTATPNTATIAINNRRFPLRVPESFGMVTLQRLQVEPGALVGMSNRVVASRAHHALRVAMGDISVDGLGDVLMTAAARRFGNSAIKVRYADRVGVVPRSEIKRMKEPVARFNRVFRR